MANFYLQDSGSAYWQIVVVTTTGQLSLRRTGTQSIVPLYLNDTGAQTWQLGVTPLGQFTTTAVATQSATSIILTGPDGLNWTAGVTTLGQLTSKFNYTLSLADAQGPVILFYFS